MDHLWTPWRFSYISELAKSGPCVFCALAAEDPSRDREKLILARGTRSFIVLNLFPYTSGHILIVPFAHVQDLPQVEPETLTEMMSFSQSAQAALEAAYHPEGYNLGMNLGRCAGAGLPDHLHIHFLPRWIGDANFLSVVGETRLLPEELSTTYDKLVRYFPR